MFTPWYELKQTEICILKLMGSGKAVPERTWNKLRNLFERCRFAVDATEAICFHGVASLIASQDGDKPTAIHHRKIEIDKILWLHEEERRNPTDGYAIQNYQDDDLRVRLQILAVLENNRCGKQGGQPETF